MELQDSPDLFPARSVVITGATAGIGKAMAHELAARGYNLGLTARRATALEETRAQLLHAHPDKNLQIDVKVVDVDEDETVEAKLGELFSSMGGVDIVVVNAGANSLTRVGRQQFAQEKQLVQTNLLGAMATVHAAAAYFIERGGGHIVGISSLASLTGIPTQAAYCATKAGFSIYLDSARIELAHHNILVTKILPGFVKTTIVENIEKYPFAVSAERAAREIVATIEKRKRVGVVPAYPWRFMRPMFGLIPDSLWKRWA